ncbi:CGNR zinc finger domain-containing protein [Streptacidiphilus monticola]|jgi:hypothetical protein|uniref:CGNR zinc finger domain-containing protein n=1 Tax=Streptacidiphilus monticola TaxID=2161674 RepID=A0ABW1G5Z1_9ACTN
MTEDPRPLPDEPLSLDLVNTFKRGFDLFAEEGGTALWLKLRGLERSSDEDATRDALLFTRVALRAAVADPADVEGLNKVLAHGRIQRVLTPAGPRDELQIDEPAWLPAWLAADDFLKLVARGRDRIRVCAHESCILHFYDTSQNGRRRWCSMERCGNRAKASRHYSKVANAKGRGETPRP